MKMAGKREPHPLGYGKPTDLEELKDREEFLTGTVFTLESRPLSLELAYLPVKEISINSNGSKPTELVLGDDRDLFDEATEVSLDSPARGPILSLEPSAVTLASPATFLAPRIKMKNTSAPEILTGSELQEVVWNNACTLN